MEFIDRYVAPEYAMTGHLLVKSDVYSYGVVLLELLTGRKPVDMSQPSGQENLVTWVSIEPSIISLLIFIHHRSLLVQFLVYCCYASFKDNNLCFSLN